MTFRGSVKVALMYLLLYRTAMPNFAHFDADEPLRDALCISSFLISMNDEGLLLGRMRDHDEWRRLDKIASGGQAFEENRWVLPASHLRIGEDPGAAAERIASGQIKASFSDLSLWRVLSFASPFPSRDQDLHWDICFVYSVEVETEVVPPWFADLKRVAPGDVASLKYARGHGDVIRELGLTT